MAEAPQAAPQEGGGGFAEALAQTDKVFATILQNPQVPDELKEQASALREGFGQLVEGIMQAAQGGASQGAQGPAAVSPEQGGSSGAVPETMGARR